MNTTKLTAGTVHNKVPKDLQETLTSIVELQDMWEDLTPLARNEWICWVENAKQEQTRKRRIEQTRDKMLSGMRRPCCWAGCIHRVKNGK